jgi:hypothetical protein
VPVTGAVDTVGSALANKYMPESLIVWIDAVQILNARATKNSRNLQRKWNP